MLFDKSNSAFKVANEVLVGGVNSPARAFKAVDRSPLFIKQSRGAKVVDIDGNEFIDYVCSWGAIILGHSHEKVVEEVKKTLSLGSSFGAPTLLETKMAKLIIKCFPFIKKVRMVNSGTEATFSAIRLARGHTGKNKILKFKGCYHGHGDSFLIAAGSGAATLNQPDSPGVTPNVAKDTLLAEFNDFAEVEKIFDKHHHDLAAIIIEPIAGNMGLIKSETSFLENLREITKQYKTLLIFDEVMTGFRLSLSGASGLYKINPDLICLGKIIGGGFPVGAFGGGEEIMNSLSPNGPVYQAGTLSGNPVAMKAGITVLTELINQKEVYQELEEKTNYFIGETRKLIRKFKLSITINRVGSMFTLFFNTNQKITNFKIAKASDVKKFARFFNAALELGSYFPPSQFEAAFLNRSHSYEELDATLNHVEQAFKKIS